uniref:Epithelial cell transforming 2 like n=1 Tax=Sparus aurata TaxID=8175 RepID=A0A671YWR6_SPAAU
MEPSLRPAPHSVKRWQLGGTDYDPQPSQTLFSSWTPLNHKTGNLQLFEERMKLVLHWFDLWTDRQRKHLLHALLARCSGSQLSRHCRDLLVETVPVTRVDFTAVLPRFLSLYVMSFLTPRDLCAAAQVSWHWRILAEQDCLWAGRCIRRGWFLPYAPGEKEFGAWKNHYVACFSTLDWLAPREAAEQYGTLNLPSPEEEEEEEEGRKERRIRQMIRDKVQEEKSEAWGGYTKPGGDRGGRPGSGLTLRSWPSVSWTDGSLSLDRGRPLAVHLPPPALLLLVSDRIPAYELLLSGVKAGVVLVLYDHRGTLPALLAQAERAVSGQRARRLGLLAPGGTEEIHLLRGSSLSEQTLRTPDCRDFWEKLCGRVAPTHEGGGVDIFSPLAASGAALIQTLSALTGLEVRAPMGLATGSFQNILSEWSDGSVGAGLSDQQPASPALQYVCEGVLRAWCSQAQWMEEVLEKLRARLAPQLQRVGLQTVFDWRGAVARELHHSEGVYLSRLGAVMKVYHEPLTAALNSNRAILSFADIHTVLRPVAQILELNRVFQADLRARLQQWGAEQCVGDVFLKLCSKLRVYTNYLNSYATAVRAIDKCRETKPRFRAFLNRSDRTLATHMLSLQELLLCPVWRMQEYVTLLQALTVHTHPGHPDHTHLSSALGTLLRFRGFIQKVLRRERQMEETQQMIRGCPSLSEGNRQLILTQDAALLRSPDEQIPDSLRTFEQVSDVGLFLFNDALVLTRRNVHHAPFTPAHRSTHTFLASVALCSLAVREITHSRYVSHAFVLDGPCRSWVCATESGEEREHFLLVLRSAIDAALTEHQ